MTLRPLPIALALCLASLPAHRAAADDNADNSMLGLGPRTVPAPPPPAGPMPEMRSTGLLVGGLSVGGLGVAGAIVGLFLMASNQGCPYVASPTGCVYTPGSMTCNVEPRPCMTKRDIGETVLTISAPVVAVGLIMAIVGAQPAPRAPEQTGRLVPEVMVGPTGGALRWRF
jgi:hypothetical protein